MMYPLLIASPWKALLHLPNGKQGWEGHRPAQVELLEERRLLSAAFPTANEQYLVELINRARANPSAEAASFGVDLNEGLAPGTITAAAKQPLAINPLLVEGARGHSQWMLDNDLFQHDGPGTMDPGDRMAAAGYAFTGDWKWGENIGWRGTTPGTPDQELTTRQLHQDLFVDAGIADRGHRLDLLNPDYREVGTGVQSGQFSYNGTAYNAVMASEDFASSGTSVFLTGVAYSDTRVQDHFYTPGEGLGQITVTATNVADHTSYQTTTWESGGYSLALAPGTYQVSASGDGLSGTVAVGEVTVGEQNVKRDVTTDLPSQARVRMRVADGAAGEAGGDAGSFLLTREGNTDLPLVVDYTLGGTAVNGVDYGWLQGSATIPAGNSTVSVFIRPVDDAVYDPGETVTLSLQAGSNYLVDSGQASATISIADNDPPVLMMRNTLLSGADAGGPPVVHGFDAQNGAERFSFSAYDAAFTGGVRVAAGDVTGDGRADVITAAGPGAGPHVKVFDGRTMQVAWSFFAYAPAFTGGVYVAAGDLNGDGKSDVLTGAAGAPHVKAFDGATHGEMASFFAYDPAFDGGVRVACADLDGDGRADIITGAGPGAGPHVRAWSGATVGGAMRAIESFFADDAEDRGGLYVAGAG
jgi:uncharacterized protein YkwD